jgi:glutamate formiminotransferase
LRELIECIPNFSTSDAKVAEALLNEIRSVEEVYVFDYTYDSYYNRLVVTYVGNKDSVFEAAINSAMKGVDLIDMNKQKGQHPRVGAVDIVPFVPIRGVTMEACVDVARRFGKTLAAR